MKKLTVQNVCSYAVATVTTVASKRVTKVTMEQLH